MTTNDMVNSERVELLVAGLRSDRFVQGRSHLTINPGTDTEQNCCLGVACTIAMENGLELEYRDQDGLRYYLRDEGHTGNDPWYIRQGGYDPELCNTSDCDCFSNDVVLPRKVRDWYGFPDIDPEMSIEYRDEDKVYDTVVSAATLNDDREFSFAQIADAFEANFVTGVVDA